MATARDQAIALLVAEKFPHMTMELHEAAKRIVNRRRVGPLAYPPNICELAQEHHARLYQILKAHPASGKKDDTEIFCKHGDLTISRYSLDLIIGYFERSHRYRTKFIEMGEEELEKCFNSYLVRQKTREAADGAIGDRFAFFQSDASEEEFAFWLALPAWTADEATALSFGKDPNVVNTTSLNSYAENAASPFCRLYRQRLQWTERTVSARQATQISPQAFVEWSQSQNFKLPTAMESALAVSRITTSTEEALLLRERLAAFESKTEELDPKLRRTYRLLILVMAIEKYGYNLGSGSPAVTAIMGSFADLGLGITDKPIRNVLQDIVGDLSLDEEIATIRKALP